MSTRVLIAEDAAHIRAELKNILLRSGCEVVGETKNLDSTVDLCRSLLPDAVFTGITLSDKEVPALVADIKKASPASRVIMISMLGQQELVIEALKSGASEFVISPLDAKSVMEALNNALKKK